MSAESTRDREAAIESIITSKEGTGNKVAAIRAVLDAAYYEGFYDGVRKAERIAETVIRQ